MATYGFQLRFLLPTGRTINHDGEAVEIFLSGESKPVFLTSVFGKNVKDASYLAIKGKEFASEDKARVTGIRVKNALLVCSAAQRMGVDVGKDKLKSGAGKFLKDMAKDAGFNLLDDTHGLSVYPENPPVRFAAMNIGKIALARNSQTFVKELAEAYEANYELSAKEALALDIYNLSHFEESSSRARFLTLVSAVECLCIRQPHSAEVIEQVKTLKDFISKSDLPKEEKESLLNGLGNLQKDSISKTARKLVKEYLGDDAMKRFQKFYEVRSRILHDGIVSEVENIGTLVIELDKLVAELLLEHIKK